MMKRKSAIFAILMLAANISWAQDFRGLDKSPMDRSYLPDNFAHDRKFAPEKTLGESATIKVVYSRPQKKGREVFGGMVKYDKIWRLGANEATEITIYQDIEVAGKTLKKGTYAMFAIPTEKDWTIIFNSDLDEWGHYSYDESNDVLRVNAKVIHVEEVIEAFSIQFTDLGKNEAVMRIGWDKTVAELPIKY